MEKSRKQVQALDASIDKVRRILWELQDWVYSMVGNFGVVFRILERLPNLI